jgi:hypothetical protein
MKWTIAFVAIASCWVGAAIAAEENTNSRLEQARSLVTSGRPAEALPIYDELTSIESTDLNLLKEAGRVAIAARDHRRIAMYLERRLHADPSDFGARSAVAAAWRDAGDETQAKRSREDYVAYWKTSTDPKVRGTPFLVIDHFRTANATVMVEQCLEIAGDFGVGYVFNIYAPLGPPLSQDEVLKNYRQRIVLEHNKTTQKVLSELKHQEVPPVPTLDLLMPTGHRTLKFFDAEPDYETIRDIVGKFVESEGDLSSRPPMSGAWGRIWCMTENK